MPIDEGKTTEGVLVNLFLILLSSLVMDDDCVSEMAELSLQLRDFIVNSGSNMISVTEQASAKQQEIVAEMRRRDSVAQEEIKRLLTLEEIVEKENRSPVADKQQRSCEVERLHKVEGDVRRAMGTGEDDLPLSAASQERCAELQKRLQQLESQNNSQETRVERRNVRLNVLQAIAPLHVVGNAGSGTVRGFVAGQNDVANFSVSRSEDSQSVDATRDLWSKIHCVCND